MGKDKKVGIVLSGGAVRCFAHLGVLKALNEQGIYPDCISGVSAGSIVGVFYASGHKPDEILDYFLNKKLMSFIQISFAKGLANMKKLSRRLDELLKVKTFEELDIPLIISATNLNDARVEYFEKGSLIDKIVASCSIPVLFRPGQIDGVNYVDGGVMNNMPVEPLVDRCDKIIGVNVNPIGHREDFEDLSTIAERTFHLVVMANFINKKNKFDLFIEPDKLEEFGMFNLKQGKKIFDTGYDYTVKYLKENKSKINFGKEKENSQ
ncbi:MAG: patatin-like phospholipase family protein [Bacteroidales bacterium]|nr:patatin-like phospholipase family protein [Bacteroidales bacterium]MCF8398949.1 patatin-like phospholipase family protein [Bacteroidales bacterium]